MSGILRLESLTKGNTLKQGDKTPLKYRLFDADGEKLNIAGKSAKVRLVYPDFLTIGYEKDGLTVTQDDTVSFTIDSVIPSRIYHVEIIVDDKFIFPSRADESKFTVDKSSLGTETNIIEIVGVDQIVNTVLGRVDADINQAVTDITATNEAIQQAEQERVQGYQEIQQIIEDGALNAVPEDGSVTTEKLSDKAVNLNKTDFMTIGKNLFNPSTSLLNMTMSSSTGLAAGPSEGQLVSDYIEVLPNTEYVFSAANSHVAKFCSYDASKNPIVESISSVGVYRSHANARYIRINTLMTVVNVQVELGNVNTAFEPYGYEFNKTVPINGGRVKNYSIPSNKLEKGIVGLESFHSSNKINLFDKTTLTLNTYVTSTGTIASSTGLHLSDFIPVKEGDTYSLTQWYSSQGGVYDANKNWIARIPTIGTASLPTSFQVPINGAYVRLVVGEGVRNSWMMVPGDTYPSEYSPYGVDVPWLNQKPSADTNFTNSTFERWRGKKLLALGDSITWQDGKAYSSGQQEGETAKGYLTLLSEQLGLSSVENTAKSGAAVVNDGSEATPLSVKAKEFDYTNYDLVTILGGTNDWGRGYTLGEVSPIGSVFDDATFCGAYQSMLEYIINSNNQIRIYIFTPLKRKNSDLNNASGYSLKQLVGKVKEIGQLYGVPVLDLYNQSLFSELTFATYTKANDTVHPIDIGYKRISELIVPFLQTH